MTQTFSITPSGPFSWAAARQMGRNLPATARHFKAHQRDDDPLRMAVPLDGDFTPVAVALTFVDGQLRGEVAGTERIDAVRRQVARIFSLDHDASGYPAIAERDPAIGRLMEALPGQLPVCFTSPYETAAWAVMSQRLAQAQAARAQDHLIAQHGTCLDVAGGVAWSFPTPERLLSVRAVPGLSDQKVQRLHGVARAAQAGLLDVERLRALGDVDGPASLQAIPGIGPFWSSGIYLRGCGIVDVFPDEPVSVAALGRLHGLGDQLDGATLERLTECYRPYRMWVAVLLRVAANRGLIPEMQGRENAIRRDSRSRH